MPKQVLVITGPTACGKSALAAELAVRQNGEVINSDSVQIYRDFDVGSGKPDAATLARVPHHLFSCMDPHERFDAWQFVEKAHTVIDQVHQRGLLPVIVGGTGLYIRSLLCGLVEHGPTDASSPALELIEHRLKGESTDEADFCRRYHQLLSVKDPAAAAVLHQADVVRMRRALACMLSTGQSIEQLRAKHRHATRRYQALVVCLLPERALLYPRIDARVDEMVGSGLLDEVQRLRVKYPPASHPFGAIGYRHVCLHLDGAIEFAAMSEAIKRDTRRFAKRQHTWWNNQPAKLSWTQLPARDVGARESAEKFEAQSIADVLAATIGDFRKLSLGLSEEGIAMQAIRR